MTWSVTGRKAWLGHSPHFTRGFSQTPRTHSFAHAGAYPLRRVVVLVQSLGYRSPRPRKIWRKSATFVLDVSGADGSGTRGSRRAASGASRAASSLLRASIRLR